MSKKDPIIQVAYAPVDENLIPLSEEVAPLFTRVNPTTGETEYPFLKPDGVDENNEPQFVVDCNFKALTLNPDEIVIETQPEVRTEYSGLTESSIEELATSINENGQLQPVVVRAFITPEMQDEEGNVVDPGGQVQYHLVAGLRRILAMRKLAAKPENGGQWPVLVIVRTMTQEQAEVIALIENTDREQMTPNEVSTKVRLALAANKGNITKAATALGLGRSNTQIYKKILEACEADSHFKAVWESGALGVDAALELLKTEDVTVRTATIMAAFNIEEAKAEEQKMEVANAAKAKGADPVAAVKKAEESAKQTAVTAAGGATKSPLANVAAGKVSASSIAAGKELVETGAIKAKALSAKQIADILTQEFSPVLYESQVVLSFAMFAQACTDSSQDMGAAIRLVHNCLKKELVKPQNVVAAGAKPVGTPATPKAATKTAAKVATPATPATPVATPVATPAAAKPTARLVLPKAK